MLKKLQLNFSRKEDVIYVIGWINTCIILHSFYMDQELELQKDFLQDIWKWENVQRHFYGSVKPADEKLDAFQRRTLVNAMNKTEMLKIKLFDTIGLKK